VKSSSYHFNDITSQKVHFIAPLADLINHGDNLMNMIIYHTQSSSIFNTNKKNTRLSLTLKPKIEFKANISIKKGQKILVDYGKISNDNFLLDHGFLLKSNKV